MTAFVFYTARSGQSADGLKVDIRPNEISGS